ncbi:MULTISPECIES: DUF1878 family protein [Gracilibacillus]|nr:DUF1878 family protein [Gracilibacillus dipsosauri]
MEAELKKQQFQLYLLRSISKLNDHPFTQMLFENEVTEYEYQETLDLLKRLEGQFEEWIEEGYLHFEPLLVQFVGALCEKLEPEKTMIALRDEGMYKKMMNQFIKLHFKYKKNDYVM